MGYACCLFVLTNITSMMMMMMMMMTMMIHIESVEGKIKLPPGFIIPAALFLGDSIVDNGNNNNLNTPAKCNFPPYGKDFIDGVPTGRFTNARTPSDLIASELGISDTIPAYLDPNIQPEDLVKGVTFASGGAGYDSETTELAVAISLQQQVEMVKEYIEKLKGIVGKGKKNFILGNALFIIMAGTDDLANTYFGGGINRRLHYTIDSYTDLMVNWASQIVQELYDIGVRRIGVAGVPPIGCVPSQRTLAGGIQRACSEEYNQASQMYNNKLSAKIRSTANQHPDSKIAYVDIYNPLLQIIQNPSNYGFEVVDRGCCGTGTIEVTVLCNRFTPLCADESKYLFWDSFHPTERGYRVIVSQILQKYIDEFTTTP